VRLIRRLKPPAKSWRPFGTKERLNFTPFDLMSPFSRRGVLGSGLLRLLLEPAAPGVGVLAEVLAGQLLQRAGDGGSEFRS